MWGKEIWRDRGLGIVYERDLFGGVERVGSEGVELEVVDV